MVENGKQKANGRQDYSDEDQEIKTLHPTRGGEVGSRAPKTLESTAQVDTQP